MKKILLILLSAFTFSIMGTYAQEIDTKAAKLQEKEAKRKAKEEEKAKKAEEKAEEKAERAEKKNKKIEKMKAEYADFIANYEPLKADTGCDEVDAFIKNANDIFTTMVEVEQGIGYIEVAMATIEDPMTGEMVEQATGIRHKTTHEPIRKSDALKTYTSAGLKLTNAAATGVILAKSGTDVVTSAIKDPIVLLSVGGKVKRIVKNLKMTVNMIPLIQRNIKENTDALKFYKDNLDGEAE